MAADKGATVGGPLHTPAIPSKATPAQQSSLAGPSSATQEPTAPGAAAAAAAAPGAAAAPATTTAPPHKKKKHRAGKKRRARRQSFAAPSDTTEHPDSQSERPKLMKVMEEGTADHNFYRLGNRAGRSDESLKSDALLDHRDSDAFARPRRPSIQIPAVQSSRLAQSLMQAGQLTRQYMAEQKNGSSPRLREPYRDDEDDEYFADDRTPLMRKPKGPVRSGYGNLSESQSASRQRSARPRSLASSASSRRRMGLQHGVTSKSFEDDDYDVNNPPSIPVSPVGEGHSSYDVAFPEFGTQSPDRRTGRSRETIIDIDHGPDVGAQTPSTRLRQTQSDVRDVCIPFDQITELGEEDFERRHEDDEPKQRRRSRRAWPDLSVLEEWSMQEKEQEIIDGIHAKKVNEPLYVGGRLRPTKNTWRREEEDAPFRWTYYNEEFDASLRSHTISGLQQLGHSFRELFLPDRVEIEDSSSEEDDDSDARGSQILPPPRIATPVNGTQSRAGTRQSSVMDARVEKERILSSGEQTGQNSPQKTQFPELNLRPKRYGPRPVFWLDVLQPTWDEMRVLSRAFSIHSLTSEDIMEQEAREKVELFRNYYFVNYRTFEHDEQSEDHLEPVNMYFIVFKGGVISFHFSQNPHPPLVRRRMRQLAEHQYTDSDWIAYAIIDNITDAYAPLIEQIEKDVDGIDDDILVMHRQAIEKERSKDKGAKSTPPPPPPPKHTSSGMYDRLDFDDQPPASSPPLQTQDVGRDMLLRIGECRKQVMGLYRLLGNKADVIKGLAKRCNEQWQVAPRSDVGLYLGDIQDHIVTMTANLTHYETILSRAHSNYLAQLNMSMNESAERNADVLGKLTVLGTIVLPMNIVTGMWGMNVLVPGQDDPDSLLWFWGISLFLLAFGVSCFFVAKKVYGIV